MSSVSSKNPKLKRASAMKHFLASLCLLGSALCASSAQCTVPASEFRLKGDYLMGGLFDIHHASTPAPHIRPEIMKCSSKPFTLSSYRRFQLMRFAVEEINNSTELLPNVSIGYQIFDHCSDTHNFPGIFDLISNNGLVHRRDGGPMNLTKVIAVVGTYTSTETLTAARLLMMDLMPMVSYGAASSSFSTKQQFPSFFRTVHPNKDVVEVVVNILLHFNWRWVAFLNIDSDYGKDSHELFRQKLKGSKICLAYSKGLNHNTNYTQVFKHIEAQKVNILIVFAPEWTAERLIRSAIQLNVTNKVWIAGDAWSLNKKLPKEKGIRKVGTVLGVAEPKLTIPGFDDFIYSTERHRHCKHEGQVAFCGQVCNCSSLTAEDVIQADPSFSVPVYSAVYAVAHALHSVLQCRAGSCKDNVTVYPHMVLAELKKSNFPLLNQSVQFDKNGDPMFGSYSVIYWNSSGEAQEVGFYSFPPSVQFVINNTQIQWHGNGEVPTSMCSAPCPVGYRKKQDGIHKCCFTCHICLNGTYVNSTEDPYMCQQCKESEWSEEGSTSCNVKLVEYIPFTDSGAVLIMVGAWGLVAITLAMSVLFAVNYNTPVVRSAGGPMCFLILGCLSLSTVSIFFYFDKPSVPYCIMRYLPFLLFYTVCVACFVVRSFQIVCVFKMAAKFPKLHGLWMKYHGQWLVITVAFLCQAFLLIFGLSSAPPTPFNETLMYPDKIILGCDINLKFCAGSTILLVSLCFLCFIFSYMGKDLPKNYNEAKAITFCLLLLILTWIIFSTVYILYRGKYIQTVNAVAVLSSLYFFLLWYFLPKCYIIIFQPEKNTQQYFQGLIQNYTKTISQ